MIDEMNQRSREIFRRLVENYLETGAPVGSKTVASELGFDLSPATVRNIMAQFEKSGLLFSPHISAGRIPTQVGLRLFVDGLLEVGNLSSVERSEIEARCAAHSRNVEDTLTEATTMLSGLSHCAGLVMVPQDDTP